MAEKPGPEAQVREIRRRTRHRFMLVSELAHDRLAKIYASLGRTQDAKRHRDFLDRAPSRTDSDIRVPTRH